MAVSPLFGYHITLKRPDEEGRLDAGLMNAARHFQPHPQELELGWENMIDARMDLFERIIRDCEKERKAELDKLPEDAEIKFSYRPEWDLLLKGAGRYVGADRLENRHWRKMLEKGLAVEQALTPDANYSGYNQGFDAMYQRQRLPYTGPKAWFKNRFDKDLPPQESLADFVNRIFDVALTTVGRPRKPAQ